MYYVSSKLIEPNLRHYCTYSFLFRKLKDCEKLELAYFESLVDHILNTSLQPVSNKDANHKIL